MDLRKMIASKINQLTNIAKGLSENCEKPLAKVFRQNNQLMLLKTLEAAIYAIRHG